MARNIGQKIGFLLWVFGNQGSVSVGNNLFFSDLPQSFPKDGFVLQSQAPTGCESPLDEVNVNYG